MASGAAYAYQVERSKFDKILLDHARSLGAEVRENTPVSAVIRDGQRAAGVTYVGADGVTGEIRARFVVDASGHQSRIYNQVGGSRNYSEFFRNIAIFGYFEGGLVCPERTGRFPLFPDRVLNPC
jgi:halogenation protein CepH